MNKYVNKDGREIHATEKAFNVLYKAQGFTLATKSKKKSGSKEEVKGNEN
ncbi:MULTISPECIES: hypothetical protein [Cytobacillus]|nr:MULTISPECIES: hypothetical protein [Cytobacillus]MCM3394864.1 hypothetical protein [Cytobacillus oceanisediminis]UQX56056.1 hypothetical protein M5V91_10745 [Cytobacillus pseudoceanisediminis]